jgi:hypothetical protein
MTGLLADLTTANQLLPARLQMAFTLGFHIWPAMASACLC